MKLITPLKLTVAFVARNKVGFVVAIVFRTLWELMPMQVPLIAGAIIDSLTGEPARFYGFTWLNQSSITILHAAGLCFFCVAGVYGLSAYLYTTAAARLSHRFVSDLRKKIQDKMLSLSLEVHQKISSGDMLDRVLLDTSSVRQFPDQVFLRSCTNIFRIGYPLVMLFVLDSRLALIAVTVIPPLWFSTWYLQQRLHYATRASLNSKSSLTSSLMEVLNGVETVKTLQGEPTVRNRLHDQMDQVESLELRASSLTAKIRGVVWLLTTAGVGLVWWQGGLRVLEGKMTVGTLVIFMGLLEFTYRPFRFFTNIVKVYQKGMASLYRICELLNTPSTVINKPSATTALPTSHTIELDSVFFAQGDAKILENVSARIREHQVNAFVGRSGSGKSTLLRLIARLYDPIHGEICIGGQDIRNFDIRVVRSSIVLVPQHPVIFSGTVRENLTLGVPEATKEQLRRCCEEAGAWEFLQGFPAIFETQLGQGGVNLSGGQAQRLALARALLRRPKILLLDEPTSALDGESRECVLRTLYRISKEITIVIAAHQFKTIRDAAHIFVMDSGRIVAEGSHESLQLQCDIYNELFPDRVLSEV